MTQLNCSAWNCIHNKDEYCCKGDIMVGGKEAEESRSTCCTSFRERREDSTSNSTGSPSETIEVDCRAEKCIFNQDQECSADSIGIAGPNASQSEETECASFRCNS